MAINFLLTAATGIAIAAHQGQTRKNNDPYVFHPIRVASMLALHNESEDVCAAALLHDVLEDTFYSIPITIPYHVKELVELLTNRHSGEPGNKMASIEKLKGNRDAILIKMADRLDNYIGETDCTNTNKFSVEYLKRKSVRKSTEHLLFLAREIGLGFHPIYIQLESVLKSA